MLENVLYLFAEISLLTTIVVLLLQKTLFDPSIKSYFKITKIGILINMIFAVLFYNKIAFDTYFESNSYTVMFYVLTSIIVFAWVSLSIKWFVSEEASPFWFCILSILALLSFDIIIKTVNLGFLFVGLSLLSFVNYRLLRFSEQQEEFHSISKKYIITILFFAIFMLTSLIILTPQNWAYDKASEFIGISDIKISILIIVGILFFILILFGIAPFHFSLVDALAPSVLPVATYFNLVPLFALFAVFIKLNTMVFVPSETELNLIYSVFGILSLIIGAIGANSSRNLKKIFAYSGVYNLGMLLLLVSPFTAQNLLGGFIYLQVYILALFGIYTSFYSFKSNGMYLSNLNMINGIAKVRPFISAAMLLFMLSLMGIAPFPGFVGQLSALESFVENGSYITLFTALLCMLILMAAYLQIIRSMYFNKREVDFNRPDYGVYIYLLINMGLIAILIFKPEFLLYDAPAVLNLVL